MRKHRLQHSSPRHNSRRQAARAAAPGPTPSLNLGDLAERAGNNIDKHTNMLFGLAAGLAGAPSIGTGLGRAFAGASAGGQLDTKQNH